MEREQSLKFMHDLLRALVARRGSDLFITSGFPPAIENCVAPPPRLLICSALKFCF